ncbi:MAG: Uma2 family endonuclease [Deltaproteobacteria bacterium]|nr:Uma2 family endonuclease [Deltaproteobacteria bacterium]
MVAELIDGELHLQPRPSIPHASAASRLFGILFDPFSRGRGGPGGWTFLFQPELHFGVEPDILVPDLAGWRRERLPELPDAPFLTLAQDWVCEIVSPGTSAVDRGRKRRIYARESVGHLWLVDPLAKVVEIYRLHSGRWTEVATFEGNAVVRAEPFDAIELDLAILWER